MIKTQLYFDVNDTEYFDRFKQYLLANYNMYFDICEDSNGQCGACIVSDYINKRNKKGVFLIKEEKGDAFKFSRASEICTALMEFNNLGAEKAVIRRFSGPLVVCVTSAAGGAGKSIISQAISCEFAQKGKKVLYINPNPFSSFEKLFGNADKNAYTRLRYYIRKKDAGIVDRTKSLAVRNPGRRVDYIINSSPSADGFLTAREASWFMNMIADGFVYDVVVFDIPSFPGEGHIEVMRHAKTRYLVFRGNENEEKHSIFKRYLESQGIAEITDVANFSDTGEHFVPEVSGIFDSHPMEFWNAIGRLCRLAEEKHEISN